MPSGARKSQYDEDHAELYESATSPPTRAGSFGASARKLPLWRIAGIVGGIVAFAVILALVVVIRRQNDKLDDDNAAADNRVTVTSEGFTNDVIAGEWRDKFVDGVVNTTIKGFMREFSEEPHLAGSPRNIYLAERTAAYFRDFGMDDVRIENVPVLLEKLNSHAVTVHEAGTGAVRYSCILEEPNIVNQSAYGTALPPSNGYSGNGTATAPAVWANYGRLEDFELLTTMYGADFIKGKVVVTRYGKIFRGNKAQLAERFGAVAIIIAIDPDTTGEGRGKVFPEGPWSTNLTVQRGSVYTGDGDPMTPFWPSEEGGPVLSGDELFDKEKMIGNPLPTIPVQPMGYGDAREVLRGLAGGNAIPAAWRDTGFMPMMGGGVGPSNYNVTVTVDRDLVRKAIANVHGVIHGAVEPDRVVIIGSHRDAWTYGAVDPISGASVVLEIARVLGGLHKTQGWRPRRSLQFSSWSGEEWGLLGSVEYVERNVELLRQRGVAYINVDTAVTGIDEFSVSGSPSMEPLAKEVATSVKLGSNQQGPTLSSKWPSSKVVAPGSGSDHMGFIQLAGVPIMYPEMGSSDGRYGAVYHSNYDCLEWVEKFGDPEFQGHVAMVRFIGKSAMHLADLNIVPLSADTYASKVAGWVNEYSDNPNNTFADFGFINSRVNNMKTTAAGFTARRDAMAAALAKYYPNSEELKKQGVTPFRMRATNDVAVGLERIFLGGAAETDSQFFKHVLFTPSAINSYGSTVMPLIADSLASKDATLVNFNLGRIGQFIGRASQFLNTTVWWV